MDDLIGSATIQLVGEVGGAVHGHMSTRIGDSHTEYVVRSGELSRRVMAGSAARQTMGSSITEPE